MKSRRLHLAIVLTALGALVAWAAHAQELFLPPPVLQPEAKKEAEKRPPAVTSPLPTKPKEKPKSKEKNKGPDPTLIIPPEVYDLPRPVEGPPPEGKPGLLLTEGTEQPPPLFPKDGKGPTIPAPAIPVPEPMKNPLPELPMLEPKPLVIPPVPPSPPEPTKVLVVQPIGKDPLPVVPKTPPEPLKVQIEPPPLIKKTPEVPPQPPTLTFPQTQVTQPPPARGKSFIRLNSASNDPMPPPIVDPAPVPPQPVSPQSVPPPKQNIGPKADARVNLNLPAIHVEKHGPTSLRAGETQSFQIVIRNLGSGPAQQLRIEDDLPAGVKLVDIGPQPHWQGSRAVWTLSNLAPGAEQLIRMTLKADIAVQLGNTLSAHVSAVQLMQTTNTVSLRTPHAASALTTRLVGPEVAVVGKPAVFEIHVANKSQVPLTGIVLFGYLPEGLDTKEGREIQGSVGGAVAPGATKILRMPTNAVKPGRYTVRVKVVTNAGEASATSTLEIGGDSLSIQQAPATRMFIGRDGDLQFQVANGTSKAVRNVAVACRLPEGLDFVGATDRGLYQSNYRTVYWMIDTMPAGHTHTLAVRVHGDKPGKLENLVFAKADGIAEIRSSGMVALEGSVNLNLNVVGRDNLLEVNKDTVYEIQIANTGGAPARNVRLRVQFPAGLIPRDAQGNTKHSVASQTVTFDPIALLGGDEKAVFRISAHAQSAGDQRIEFSVISDEVQTPIQREISTRVY